MSFFAELKRRNVIRMGGLYLVGSWLVLQVAETLLPLYDTPDWVLKSLVLLLALGFIPALVFSWIFELTPDGLKRDSGSAIESSIATQTGRRMDRLILIGMAALATFIAVERFWPNGQALSSTTSTAGVIPAAQAGGQLVAVLPFRNRSALAEDAFFAEGIHDDLLTQLSKIAGLKVISRTSVMRYADTEKSIKEIGGELGAAVVLEGAVQRAGDQVLVNVQLIDASTDVHLWAENYDRALSTETIFAIQADIAGAVAGAMRVVLSPNDTQSLIAGSTSSLKAYEAYLHGRLKLLESSNTDATLLQEALAAFDQAIELDPTFAEAYALKARVQLSGYWFAITPQSSREAAKISIEKARALAPEAIETQLAEAYYDYWGLQDYASADARLQRILQRVPDNSEAWGLRAYVARRDGRFEESLSAARRALELDPLSGATLTTLAETLRVLGRTEESVETLERAEAIGIDTRFERMVMGETLGNAQMAWKAVDGLDSTSSVYTFRAALLTRDPENLALALSPALWPQERRSPPDFPESYALAQAEALRVQGDMEQALQLAQAIRARVEQRDELPRVRWAANAYYLPCDLPGLLGDLDGVKAAERDYLDNAPADAWAESDIHLALAIAFARAGDADRALDYLEGMVASFGPATYLRLSINPGLDSLRELPRYQALRLGYEASKAMVAE